MHPELQPNHERHPRGRLYFLSHPGSEIFSGYGLTIHHGRSDRLVGLLMVDRPHRVDPAWLQQIEQFYGDCQLAPMTATGERGLVTQMRVAPGSVQHLQPCDDALAEPLAAALKPLLDAPPAPILKLRWDPDSRLWRSAFWIGLPPHLQEVFERNGYGSLAVERGDTVSFVTHAPARDIAHFHRAPVRWRWELIEMPTAPLIRFHAAILDDPASPYLMEHFLNVDDRTQARCLSRLVQQDALVFDFFDHDYEYAYSKQFPHLEEARQGLDAIVRRAIDVYGRIPAGRRDFDRAKAAFQRRHPL